MLTYFRGIDRPPDHILVLKLKELLEQGYLKRPLPQHWMKILSHGANVVSGLDYVALSLYLAKKYDQSLMHGFGRGGWAEYPQTHNRFQSFEVLMVTEQAPDPNNRVLLGRDRDALGMPRVELHWKWGTFNIENAQRTQALFGQMVHQNGIGRMVPNLKDGKPFLNGPAGMAHHMGTTRMSSHPNRGVVNENCQVHGIPNLYIASSSVFPTGSYANPTLTILALSLRLANYLKNRA